MEEKKKSNSLWRRWDGTKCNVWSVLCWSEVWLYNLKRKCWIKTDLEPAIKWCLCVRVRVCVVIFLIFFIVYLFIFSPPKCVLPHSAATKERIRMDCGEQTASHWHWGQWIVHLPICLHAAFSCWQAFSAYLCWGRTFWAPTWLTLRWLTRWEAEWPGSGGTAATALLLSHPPIPAAQV